MLQMPMAPGMPMMPQMPKMPIMPKMPSAPAMPRIGDLGSFNNSVNNFINKSNLPITNPFDDPSRFRSLGDVVLSRKLIRENSGLLDFFGDALGWVGDNIIGNIPIIGGAVDDFIDGAVEGAKNIYDDIKATPFVGDLVSLAEDYNIRWVVGLPERLAGYVNHVLIEPLTWGSDPLQAIKMDVLSILNAVGKDLDLITGANAIKSVAIPLLTGIVSQGKAGSLDPAVWLENLYKSVGLDEEAGLTHYEWNTGLLTVKDIPLLGDITGALVDLFDPIKDVPLLGLLYDVSNMANEISLLDFGLEILSSPDTYVSFGLSGALDALGKKLVKAGGALDNVSDAIKRVVKTSTDALENRESLKTLLDNIKSKGAVDAFTDYYYSSIISNLNDPTFVKTLSSSDVDKLLKRIKSAKTPAELSDAQDALKNYLRSNVSDYLKGSAKTTAHKELQHAFEIAERWRAASNTMETLQGLARYNNPIYAVRSLEDALGINSFYSYVTSKWQQRKLNKMKAMPKDSYFYDDYILTRQDKEAIQSDIDMSLKTYINSLPRGMRNIEPKVFLEYYEEAVNKVRNSAKYKQGLLDDDAVHRAAIQDILKRLEGISGIKISDKVKRMLTELNIKGLDISKVERTTYRGFSEFFNKLRAWDAANKAVTFKEISDISKYFNDYASTLSKGYNTNYARLKDIKQNLITKGNLADYKSFFKQAQADVAEHSIKEFENLLNLMHLDSKDLRTIDALLDLKDSSIQELTKVFRKNKIGNDVLYSVLKDTLDKRYKTLINTANIPLYKRMFRKTSFNVDPIRYFETLQQTSKDLFGEVVHRQIQLDLNNRIAAATEAYGVKLNTDNITDIIAGKKNVYAQVDNAGRLNGRRIVTGDVARQQNAVNNLAKGIKSLFDYKEYLEYMPYKDKRFYEEYAVFSDEIINNLSKTIQELGRNDARFNVIKTDIIPLYKRIFKEINPTDLTKAPTEKQLNEIITNVILKKYQPDDLIRIADELQEVRVPMASLMKDLDDAVNLGETPDILKDMTVTSLRQFNDFINTLTQENISYEFKNLAETTNTLYNLKLANRLHQAYTMAIISKHETLYKNLQDLVDNNSMLNKVMKNITSVCLEAEDEAIQQIGRNIGDLINKTEGFFNYSDFYTELNDALKYTTVDDFATVISNELQNIITTSGYTSEWADVLTDADIDKIMTQLQNKVMMSLGSHKYISNLSEIKTKEIADFIQRSLNNKFNADIDVVFPNALDKAHRFQFQLHVKNIDDATLEQLKKYLEDVYSFSENDINILYEQVLSDSELVNIISVEGGWYGKLDEPKIIGDSIVSYDTIYYDETGIPIALSDSLDVTRKTLTNYIQKQREANLPLFSFYDRSTLQATKNINDSLDVLLKYIREQVNDDPDILMPYLFSFLNMFQGSGKTRHTLSDYYKPTRKRKVGDQIISKELTDLYKNTDDVMLNTVLTDAWNDIDMMNKWLKEYGVVDVNYLDDMSPGISNALYDVVFEKLGEKTENTVANTQVLDSYLNRPSVVARIQQKYLSYKRNAQHFKKAPENIAADRAYFYMMAVKDSKFADYLRAYTKNKPRKTRRAPSLKQIIKNFSNEDIVDLKYIFKNTDAAKILPELEQSSKSYLAQALDYYTIFQKSPIKDLDINYVRGQLGWMYRDAEFASMTVPKIIKEDLYSVLKTKSYTDIDIKNIVTKLGGTEDEATKLFQRLNRTAARGAVDRSLRELYIWCLNKIEDDAHIMSWYTTAVNNKPLYQTMYNLNKSQKIAGDAAYSYLPKATSEVLADENVKELMINGARVEALAVAGMNLERGGVFTEPLKVNKNPKNLIEKVQNSYAIEASIESGKASYDTLLEINKVFDNYKSKQKLKTDLAYNMEQTINDLQVQALFSLNARSLSDFIRDNYGLVYIQGSDLKLPWTKAQLKRVGLDIKNIDNEFIIYNTNKAYEYSNVVGTKQFADYKIKAYRDTLDKLNPLKEKLNVYTNEAYTPFGNDLFIPRTITRSTVEDLLEKFEIQEAYLNPHFFNNNFTRMDNITFMTAEWRALTQPWGLDYQTALTTSYQDIIKNENMKAKYIDLIFRDETFSPETYKELLEDCTDKEIAQFFRENKLTGVAVSTSTKGDVVFPKIDAIRVNNRADLQALLDHQDIAAVVPKNMAMNMLTAINDHAADGRLVDAIRLMNYTWKVGIVAKPGQILRNFFDTYVKNINETGRSIKTEAYKRKVAGSLNDLYNEIYEKCFELYGDISNKHLDKTLDSMLQNSKLNKEEIIILKNAMLLVDRLNKTGALDSDVMTLRTIQKLYNERYLQGFDKRQQQYIDLIQEIPGVKQMLDTNSAIERSARLALALDTINKTGDIASVIEKIDNVHFNYADKSPALQKAELFIPFNVFPVKNRAYWLNGGFKTNDLYRMIYIGLRQSWGNENGTFGQVFYRDKDGNIKVDKYAVEAITSGSMRFGDYIIKTGWSYLDAMNVVLNPVGELQSRLHPAIQYAMSGGKNDYLAYSMIPFVGPEIYRLAKGQGVNRTLTGSMFTNDYTINTLRKNTKLLYSKYPTKIYQPRISYGKYPKVSYKAMHSSNRSVAFKQYYGKVSFNSIYKKLYPKKNYAIVNLKRLQARNPNYYSDIRNVVSSVKRIKAMFR